MTEVRLATVNDAIALARLHAAAFSDSWDAAFWRAAIIEPQTLVSCIGHQVLSGMLAMRMAADEAEILTIAVQPGERKTGLGGKLLDAGIDRLRAHGIIRLFLEVAANNVAGLALYHRNGFIRSGIRQGYYPDGQDAYILVRPL